jgi:pimeloyl-ACP methyl ester carboxylesterase
VVMVESLNLHQYPFTPKRVTLESGHEISCVDEGQGKTIVFLHGNPSWSYLYRNLITSLQGTKRCIAPDHLGCGLSDKPQDYPYRLENHIDNLEQVLDQLKVETCVLVMHDWGGAIGMGWAGRHPERVDGLVLMNTAAFRSKLIPWRIAVCRWPLIGPLLVRGMNAFAGAAIYMAVTRKLNREIADGFLYPYDSWANRVAVMGFVKDIPLEENHPSWSELVKVEKGLELLNKKPMLLCWGGRDFCFHDAFYREWQRRFPGAECYHYPEAGHYLLEDEFEAVKQNIAGFLATHADE